MTVTSRRIIRGEAELYRQTRLAVLLDAPAAFSTSYAEALKRSPQEWREQAEQAAESPDRAIFFLFDGDLPVGMAGLYRDPDQSACGELIQVWVEPEYRAKGVAADLLEATLAWAGTNSFLAIRAGVTAGNSRALAFYRKCGFTLVAEPADDDQAKYILEIATGGQAGGGPTSLLA